MKPSGSEIKIKTSQPASLQGNSKIRLQVFLSHSGVCSRRKALEHIKEGCVTVNGNVATEPSTSIDIQNDKICFNGREVKTTTHAYVMLNKPQGYVTTLSDPHAGRIISDLLPKELKHLYPAGRLDKDTEGLLLLTNDGDVAYKLTHPKFNVDKVYYVRIAEKLQDEEIARLKKGVVIEGEVTAPAKISNIREAGAGLEFLITIHEGRKRQVRMMLAACGHKVTFLKRLAQGPLALGDLPKGQWRPLTAQEINALKKL